MDDHAGRIQRAAESRAPGRRELPHRLLAQVARVVTRPDCFTRARESDTRRLDRERGRLSREALVTGKLVYRRQVAKLQFGPV